MTEKSDIKNAKKARSQKHANKAADKAAAKKPKGAGAPGEANRKNDGRQGHGDAPALKENEGTDKSYDHEERKKIAAILEKDRREALCHAILQCRNIKESRAFLIDLCTPQEIDTLAERWVLARLLAATDLSYREISAATGASTTTVGRVARFLQQEGHKGYRLVLDRLGTEKDEHADSQSGKG